MWELLYCGYQDQCLLICLMVIVSTQWLKGVLTRGGTTEMKRISIDPQIKSAHSGYQDGYCGYPTQSS